MLVWWSDQTSNWMPWLPRAQHPENKSCKSFKARVKAFWQCGEYGCDMCHLRNWPSQPLSIPTAAGLCGCNSLHRPRVSICSICIIPKNGPTWANQQKSLIQIIQVTRMRLERTSPKLSERRPTYLEGRESGEMWREPSRNNLFDQAGPGRTNRVPIWLKPASPEAIHTCI
jgi:hypothetical protein